VHAIVGQRETTRRNVLEKIKRVSDILSQDAPLTGAPAPEEALAPAPAAASRDLVDVARRLSKDEGKQQTFSLKAVFASSAEIKTVTSCKQRKEDEQSAQTILLRARFFNALTFIFWQAIALSVLLVGCGVKLAIHDPTSPADAFYAFEQRLGLGVPIAATSLIPLANSVLLRDRHHYVGFHRRRFETVRQQPWHFLLIASRLCIFFIAVGLCWVELQPGEFLAIQTAIALLQCVLLHITDYKLHITSKTVSLESKLAGAVNVLSLRAKHSRDKLSLISSEKKLADKADNGRPSRLNRTESMRQSKADNLSFTKSRTNLVNSKETHNYRNSRTSLGDDSSMSC